MLRVARTDEARCSAARQQSNGLPQADHTRSRIAAQSRTELLCARRQELWAQSAVFLTAGVRADPRCIHAHHRKCEVGFIQEVKRWVQSCRTYRSYRSYKSYRSCATAPPSSCDVERSLECFQRFLAPAAIDDDADAHLAGIDHGDIDTALGQGAEHPASNAGVGAHADAGDNQPGDGRVGCNRGLMIDGAD